jgi:hypothetical protein
VVYRFFLGDATVIYLARVYGIDDEFLGQINRFFAETPSPRHGRTKTWFVRGREFGSRRPDQ